MRKRAARMILIAVAVVVLLLGLPGAFFASRLVWQSHVNQVQEQADVILSVAERQVASSGSLSQPLLMSWATDAGFDRVEEFARVRYGSAQVIELGTTMTGPTIQSFRTSAAGVTVLLKMSAYPAYYDIAGVCGVFAGGIVISLLVGWWLANRLSRRLSAPLIYLAAQAEQIGSGQVRAHIRPSGIEEIDLVQEELVRTGERMAGRLAAERQFAADASHQLRTPLTALSMRLEEIDMISTDPQVQREAQAALEQVERMTTVVTELLDTSSRVGGTTEAVHLLEIFNIQREEWEPQFEKADRELIFTDEAEMPVLADAAQLGQVLATLIENSLRYGDGTTRIVSRKATKRGVVIEVSDEGQGVDSDLAPHIFENGVSGHGSTGIGLALAKDLIQGMGGRLELAQEVPAVFRLSVAAIPAALDPNLVMPEGPMVSIGRRSRRF